MTSALDPTRAQFDRAYRAFKAHTESSEVAVSSRTWDYTDHPSYRDIIKLGPPALPHAIAKLREGDFLLNEAVLQMAGCRLESIVPDASQPYSEQDVSRYILAWWARMAP